MSKNNLLSAVDKLQATFRKSVSLADSDFGDKRRDAVLLRRAIATCLPPILSASETAFDDGEARKAFRSEFPRMRSLMALHYASWPVVAVDRDDPTCVASLQSHREGVFNFIAWVRAATDKL